MSHRTNIQPNAFVSAEPRKLSFNKVGAIICDDAMWIAISQNDLLDEGYNCLAITLPDWFHLHSLGKFVHHH